MTCYDLPTGYGGFILWLIGGPRLVPAVGYMGGKRRLAPDIGRVLGLRPRQRLDRIVLADAGCPGWVWPHLLDRQRAARVAEVLWGWRHEGPVELWGRLVELPPAADPAERAAQVLWLQGRMATNCPLIWNGARWEMGDKPRKSGGPSRRVVQVADHGATTKVAFQRKRSRADGLNVRSAGGVLSPVSVARRVEAIAAALDGLDVTFHHGDLFDVLSDAGRGDVVYLDPDYVGCTSYGATVPRDRLLSTAEDLRARGARVAISEAVPLPLDGWNHVDLTRAGGKPEWLTCSDAPARLPGRVAQLDLWGAA